MPHVGFAKAGCSQTSRGKQQQTLEEYPPAEATPETWDKNSTDLGNFDDRVSFCVWVAMLMV